MSQQGPATLHQHRAKRSPVGAAPGTLIADPDAPQPALTLFAIAPSGARVFDDVSLADVGRLRAEWPLIWLDCVGLGDVDLIARLGEMFNLHRLALEDVVNTSQRPKADFFDEHVYVVLKMLEADRHFAHEQISILFADDFVLTFQERPGDAFDPVRKRIAAGGHRLLNRKADYLAYALIDAVVDAYFPLVDKSGDMIDLIEDEMLGRARKQQAQDLHRLRREMIVLKRWLWPVRDAVAGLMRSETPYVHEETRVFLNDTLDHTVRLIEIVETYREMLTGLIDMHLSLVQARTNDVISLLTIISAIFIPLTFLVGVWGMNFDPDASPWNMPELRAYYGYPVALGAMVSIALALIGYFRWRRWL
jgi:magnesium transporter